MFSIIQNEETKQKGLKEKENQTMENKTFMTVEDVAAEMSVSKSYAYKIVKQLNAELQKMGYLTVAGRVNTNYFRKKVCYSE